MIDAARILFTVFCFGAFIGIVLITYRKGAKGSYDDIAQEIVDDDDVPEVKKLRADSNHANGAK